ncbi:MAG: two-component regulator propeller domain-containing protein [bacterium]|nr:hypothetical protein [candidate division KSB1 bacterium]MDH7558795.1 two-component regulator propeller domain-containing protein [bacterium]
MRASLHIALVLVVMCSGAQAGVGDWKSFTSANSVRVLITDGQTIYAGTTGGLVRIDGTGSHSAMLTNTEGLPANTVTALALESSGGLWIGTSTGSLAYLSPDGVVPSVVNDYKGHTINDLQAVGDSLFVALDFGVSLYDLKRREVKENYKRLGNALNWYTSASALLVIGNEIWVATPLGLARADLRSPNLMDPQFWTNYRMVDGLPSDKATALAYHKGAIYVGTGSGLARWSGTAWEDVGLSGFEVTDVAAAGDSVLVGTTKGVYLLTGDGSMQQKPWAPWGRTAVLIDAQGGLWLGSESLGLHRFAYAEQTWRKVRLNVAEVEVFSAMAIDRTGSLWCASGADGVAALRQGQWVTLTASDGLSIAGHRAVVVDGQNRKWFGTAGRGVTIIEEEGDWFRFSRIDTTGGRLSGSDTPANVIVEKLVLDSQGNVWILNKYAANRRPLAVVSPIGQWQYFSLSDGIPETAVTCMAIDQRGWKWIGMQNQGVVVLDDGGTPFDKSDDQIRGTLTTADGLFNNLIRSIAVDSDGVVWIGTSQGLNYWFQGTVGGRGGLLSDDINVIAVDFRNNKWIGTSAGVSVLSWDSYTWTHYSTDTSPLVGDNVQCFAFDANTGYVYIGTESGLSRLETPFTPPKADLSEVLAYPNPFVIEQGNERFHIHNLADHSTVRILTPDGLLVRYFSQQEIPGSWVEWDGRNDRYEYVASGVYLYVIYTESGLSHVGKVAVIRR